MVSKHKKCGYCYKVMLIALIFSIVSMTGFPQIVDVTKVKAAAAPSHVLIDEIFGGGGSEDTAPYDYDFIELYNPTDSSVTLDGWSLQYTNEDMDNKWERTDLTGSIPAHGYYLIREHSDDPAVGLAKLPTPDASGDIDIDNHYGDVVLTKNQVLLQDNTDPNKDPNHEAIADFVGYGSPSDVAFYEGKAPAPEATKKKSVGRKAINPRDPDGPGLDTKPRGLGEFLDNGADFTMVSDGSQVDPKNSQSIVEPAIIVPSPTPPTPPASPSSGAPNHNDNTSKSSNGSSGSSNHNGHILNGGSKSNHDVKDGSGHQQNSTSVTGSTVTNNQSDGSQVDSRQSQESPAIADSASSDDSGALNNNSNISSGKSGSDKEIKAVVKSDQQNDSPSKAKSTAAAQPAEKLSDTTSHVAYIVLGSLLLALIVASVVILLLRRRGKNEQI